MRYKVNGSAEMTDTSLVRAHGDTRRLGARIINGCPLLSFDLSRLISGALERLALPQ